MVNRNGRNFSRLASLWIAMLSQPHRRRRLALRGAAIALAGLYALLATVGDGLHELAHLTGDRLAAAMAPEGDADCDGGHCCVFCHSDDAASPPSNEQGVSEGRQAPTPHDHDCAVCQLLAQLKHAGVSLAAPAATAWGVELDSPVVDVSASSADLLCATARGPPQRV